MICWFLFVITELLILAWAGLKAYTQPVAEQQVVMSLCPHDWVYRFYE